MTDERKISMPVSIINILYGQCGNIDTLLKRMRDETANGLLAAAETTGGEIAIELEYMRKYLPPYDTTLTRGEFLTAESRQVDKSETREPPSTELIETSQLVGEAEALFTACEMAYTLDGEMPCILGEMLGHRLTEASANLRSLVPFPYYPF